MKWESFKPKFHVSWHKHVKSFIEDPACDKIYDVLKKRAGEGHKIMPTSVNTFRAFETPLEEINVVILGGNPYDGIADGITIANGLFLDCSNLNVPSYELRNFYRGIENEVYNGFSLHYKDTQSILYLKEQGVLMLNASLTTEESNTHSLLWDPFMKHIIKILDSLDVPILFIGNLAKSYSEGISNKWRVFELDDIPGSPGAIWETNGTFRRIDEYLENQNKDTIMWLNIDVPY